MEAHGVRDFPPDSLRGRFVRRALQAAVVDVILPAFAEQMLASRGRWRRAEPRPRRPQHRLPPGPHPLRRPRLRQSSTRCARSGSAVLGEHDLAALDELYARVIWIPDGDLERLDAAAREYRRDRRRARAATRARRGPASRTDPAKRGTTATGEGDERRPAAARRGLARRRARAGDRDRPRPASSSSSTRTSTSAKCCETRPPDGQGESKLGRGRGHRAADRADARPRRRPPAVPRRGTARPPLRQPAAPGDDASAPGRSTSAPLAGGSTAAPTRAAAPSRPPGDRSPRTRGGSSARSPLRSRSRTSG